MEKDKKQNTGDQPKPRKHKLTEEELKALLGSTCHGRQWFLMKKATDYNKLALFLKINGVDSIELGQKAYTYEVDLKDETIAGAFILTEKPVGKDVMKYAADGRTEAGDGEDAAGISESGTRWYIAAITVAPDYRGHDIGSIMVKKMKTLAKDDGADAVFVKVPEEALPPDDKEGIESARAFWEAEGFDDFGDGLYVCSLD